MTIYSRLTCLRLFFPILFVSFQHSTMSCRKSCLPKDDWKIVWKFFPVDDYKPEASTTSTSIVEKRWESPIILDCIDDQSLSTAVVDSIAKDHKMATTTTISLFFARSSFSLSHTFFLANSVNREKNSAWWSAARLRVANVYLLLFFCVLETVEIGRQKCLQKKRKRDKHRTSIEFL